MTYLERLKQEHPEAINDYCYSQCEGCPSEYGYIKKEEEVCDVSCEACWNKEIKIETKKEELTMNKFKLENKIIVVGTFHEYNTQYTITNLINPEMKLDLPKNAFIEEIENTMKGKVATTILDNMLHNQLVKINSLPILEILYDKLEKEIDKIKKIMEEDNQTKINYLYEEENIKIEIRDVTTIN